MTLKEVLEQEKARPLPLIYLYKEGTFFKAYEKSAFYLSTMRGLKPIKRWCKMLGCEYVTAGFPIGSVAKFLPEATVEEDHLQYTDEEWGFPLYDRPIEFAKWKEALPILAPKKKSEEEGKQPMVTAEILSEVGDKGSHEMLSVFKRIYDLLLRFTKQRVHLDREYRYTIGQSVFERLMALLLGVYNANAARGAEQKLAVIRQMMETMAEVKIYFRLLCDTKQISVKSFSHTVEDLVAIERELKGWAAHQKR